MINKIGICQWCLPGDQNNLCAHAADLGFQGIELNYDGDWKNHKLNNTQEQRDLLRKATDHGIEFPTLGLNVFCDIGMSKAENVDCVKDIFQRVVGIALAMGIKTLQIPSFGDGEITTERELDQTIISLDYVCQLVKDEDLLIGTENALSVEDNLKITNSISSDKINIYFDTQNPHVVSGYFVPDMVEPLFPYICEVHVKDGDSGHMGNTSLGGGGASVSRTLQELKRRKYSGWFVLENDYSTDDRIREDIKFLSMKYETEKI